MGKWKSLENELESAVVRESVGIDIVIRFLGVYDLQFEGKGISIGRSNIGKTSLRPSFNIIPQEDSKIIGIYHKGDTPQGRLRSADYTGIVNVNIPELSDFTIIYER